MVVYFSASARDMDKNIGIYRTVIRAVQETGGIIAHNWVEAAVFRSGFPADRLWWTAMNKDVQNNLSDTDVVIVEASGASALGVGYELACALHAGKPVLALVDKKVKRLSYVRGIRHNALECVVYEPHTLADIVKQFITSKHAEGTQNSAW